MHTPETGEDAARAGVWTAHQFPERPFTRGDCYLCGCLGCWLHAKAQARHTPKLAIVLKGHHGRHPVPLDEYVETCRCREGDDGMGKSEYGDLECLLVLRYWEQVGPIREMFVAMPDGQRWCDLNDPRFQCPGA